MLYQTKSLLSLVAVLLLAGFPCSLQADNRVTFRQDILPILSKHCFQCHGPDASTRQAGLRLDQRASATSAADSGEVAIVPGDPLTSELIARIESADASLIMPPPEIHKPLSSEDRQKLRRWVEEGAAYETHWAFVAPEKAPLPAVHPSEWPREALDYFVLAAMEARGLAPAPEADKLTLLRRLSLDLIGLPPTPAEIDAFLKDSSPEAYDKVVDRLLASPHFGERWARRWLDLARYADTTGYGKDRTRSIWPYRDWVIQAINDDMPYDQFTIEQLAGDMLPGATRSQRIATGFHRNTMLNEEGGIDPLEYRHYAIIDRVNTTSTIWLGLTVGCAQCHTHKFDPITQQDYYQLLAFFNNCEEPTLEVIDPEVSGQRAAIEREILAVEESLPQDFPLPEYIRWHDVPITNAVSTFGAMLKDLGDHSFLASGSNQEVDEYVVELKAKLPNAEFLELQVLSDPTLPQGGPGRTTEGELVLTEILAYVSPEGHPEEMEAIEWIESSSSSPQEGFAADLCVDGHSATGWRHSASNGEPERIVLRLRPPARGEEELCWTIRLQQLWGGGNNLGRFRIRLGTPIVDTRDIAIQREEHLEQHFQQWLLKASASVKRWELLTPIKASSNLPLLTIQQDDSILASGDQTRRDTYRVTFQHDLPRITALRLEVLPHSSLPRDGPGRTYYDRPSGDFFLSEIRAKVGPKTLAFRDASHSFAHKENTAQAAIDRDPLTGWAIEGGQGEAHQAVFVLADPVAGASTIDLELLFERYYSAGLGCFRIWGTAEEGPLSAGSMPTEIEQDLVVGQENWSAEQQQRVFHYFLTQAPELEGARKKIEELRRSLPEYPTTLVMQERPPEDPRVTYRYHRGDYLTPAEEVEAKLPEFLANSYEVPRNRAELAAWLVSDANPLAARVEVNRLWGTIFGKGIVRTADDFGYRGEPPTHPELLDWLAVEFRESGWSRKQLLKRIVSSATYRQASEILPEKLEADPDNKWLARAPRVRLDAEIIRDLLLSSSGLLADRIGGPSVFPPLPQGADSEDIYIPQGWNASEGEDRYRRGLYTFTKRNAAYGMFSLFDAPVADACVAHRETTNSPLQALTLLNDVVVMEAAQALGADLAQKLPPDELAGGTLLFAESGETFEQRLTDLYLRCLGRPPTLAEQEILQKYHHANVYRLQCGELDVARISGSSAEDWCAAAWTLTARAVLNLDDAITKQ